MGEEIQPATSLLVAIAAVESSMESVLYVHLCSDKCLSTLSYCNSRHSSKQTSEIISNGQRRLTSTGSQSYDSPHILRHETAGL